MNFVLAMLARNFAVERRSLRTGFLRMVLQPAVYIFVFGYVVGRMLPGGSTGNYAQVMAPGVLAITLISSNTWLSSLNMNPLYHFGTSVPARSPCAFVSAAISSLSFLIVVSPFSVPEI